MSKKPVRVRSKYFVFTINNYTPEEEFLLLFLQQPCTYICWGYEVGEEEGTPHIQGYMEFSYVIDRKVVSKFKEFNRAYLAQRKGTAEEAIKYCKKGGNYFELGNVFVPKPGVRRDLDEVRECARDNGMKEVSQWANLQQIRCAEKYLEYNESKRNWKPTVLWFWGPTGTGKSRMAHDLSVDPYIKSEGSKWWNGYDRHEHVIIDDFRDGHMSFNELLTLLDRYERRIECKGGMRQFVAKQIIITCNAPPSDLYCNVVDERKDQLLRRIDVIEEFTIVGN